MLWQSIAEDDIGEAEEIPQPTTESQYDCNQTNTDVLKDETMDKFLSTNEEGNFGLKGESSLETGKIYICIMYFIKFSTLTSLHSIYL